VKGRSRVEISSVQSEEDAGQKSQKLKFTCCKIVKRLTVILPGEYPNKISSVKSRAHKLFVALPGNTRQYVHVDIQFVPHRKRIRSQLRTSTG
jgi:hypothetical protein